MYTLKEVITAKIESTIEIPDHLDYGNYETIDQTIHYNTDSEVAFNLYKDNKLILEEATAEEINDYFKENTNERRIIK